MNSYDFDDTIFRGNSFRRFFGYCLLRLPYLVLFTPVFLAAVILNAVKLIDKNTYLTWLGSFVVFVPNVEKRVKKFWDKEMCRIKPWYIAQRRDDDVIVSASPAYIVDEACRRLGVKCIATKVDPRTAKVDGVHCYGADKVLRYKGANLGGAPKTFYSDNWSDEPMFAYAESGYLVKGDKITLVYNAGNKIADKHAKK